MSTEVEAFAWLSDFRGQEERKLSDPLAHFIAELLRRPETERGEYRLLLRTTLDAHFLDNSTAQVTLKRFTIEWPYLSDGSDIRLSTARPFDIESEATIRKEYKDHRFVYNAATGRVEIGGIGIPFNRRNSDTRREQVFEIFLRFANTDLQTEMNHLKAEMELELPGSILGLKPIFADWSGEIIAGNGVASRVLMDQKTRARIQMTVNMRDIFDAQHYSFRYRLRLRGVEINSERIQYVKQILAERGLVVRAEGLGSPLPAGSRVGEREWLLMADRAVQGDRLILTSLVSCDTRQVMRRDESARTVIQGEDIRANTVIDVLGVLRGRREELMNEVNAYVRELRHQLGRFSAFD